MPTSAEDRKFKDSVVGELLENAMQWIGENMNCDEVFSESKLQEWALANGFIKEE